MSLFALQYWRWKNIKCVRAFVHWPVLLLLLCAGSQHVFVSISERGLDDDFRWPGWKGNCPPSNPTSHPIILNGQSSRAFAKRSNAALEFPAPLIGRQVVTVIQVSKQQSSPDSPLQICLFHMPFHVWNAIYFFLFLFFFNAILSRK